MPTIRLAASPDLANVEAIVRAAYSGYIPRIGQEPGPMLDDYAALISHMNFGAWCGEPGWKRWNCCKGGPDVPYATGTTSCSTAQAGAMAAGAERPQPRRRAKDRAATRHRRPAANTDGR